MSKPNDSKSSSTSAPAKGGPPPGPPFNAQLAMGLLGVLLAAMMAGFTGRVPSLGEADMLGALGFSHDQGTWLETWFVAGELIAMPFSCWIAITFSLRRFHIIAQLGVMAIALMLPHVKNAELFMAMRFFQGYFAGSLIPLLMMSALRFLPPPIRLHGLALYAMTATLAPNVAVWMTAIFIDQWRDWRWLYWHVIPIGAVAIGLVYYGIPKMPLALPRLKQANYLGLICAVPGFIGATIVLTQGLHLDWLNSHFFIAALIMGAGFSVLFLWSEWHHPSPFMKLQMLSRRNLGLGFTLFFILLIVLSSGVVMPLQLLANMQGFRMTEMAPIALWIGLPQIFLGSVVAFLLYQSWVDARVMFSIGLICIGTACWLASGVTSDWMAEQFIVAQILQAIGQPMAVVCMLFLGTSVVQPMEGPFVAGIINTLRVFGTLTSGALLGQVMTWRNQFHFEGLVAQWNSIELPFTKTHSTEEWTGLLVQQSQVLASEDTFLILGSTAFLMVPFVMCLQFIPAPKIPRPIELATNHSAPAPTN